MTEPPTKKQTPEQQARDMLQRMDVPGAQAMSAGEVVELANLIEEAERLRALLKETWDEVPDYVDGRHDALEARILREMGEKGDQYLNTDDPLTAKEQDRVKRLASFIETTEGEDG